MPTGTGDYDLGTVKNDVEMFEEMRKQARQEWAGTSVWFLFSASICV